MNNQTSEAIELTTLLAAQFAEIQTCIDRIETLVQAYISSSIDVDIELGKESGSTVGVGINVHVAKAEERFVQLQEILERAASAAYDVKVTATHDD